MCKDDESRGFSSNALKPLGVTCASPPWLTDAAPAQGAVPISPSITSKINKLLAFIMSLIVEDYADGNQLIYSPK
jgi:hypothetical protein